MCSDLYASLGGRSLSYVAIGKASHSLHDIWPEIDAGVVIESLFSALTCKDVSFTVVVLVVTVQIYQSIYANIHLVSIEP